MFGCVASGAAAFGCGEEPPTPVIRSTRGPASCPGPQVLLFFAASARRAGSLAACLRVLQVASVSLDLMELPIARPSVGPCFGMPTSRDWKRSSIRRADSSEARSLEVNNRYGAPLESEGSSCGVFQFG